MKTVFILLILLSSNSYAHLCDRYQEGEYYSALTKLASHINTNYQDICTREDILDIEIAPSQIITNQGEVIPHLRISFHKAYSTCQYFLSRRDFSLTKMNCYDTW